MKPSDLVKIEPMGSVFQKSEIESLAVSLVRYQSLNGDQFGEIDWSSYIEWRVEQQLVEFVYIDANTDEWWKLLSNFNKSNYEGVWLNLLNEKLSIFKTTANVYHINNQNDWLIVCNYIQNKEMQVLFDLNPLKKMFLTEMKNILLNNAMDWLNDFNEVKCYLVSADNAVLFSPYWMQVAKALQ